MTLPAHVIEAALSTYKLSEWVWRALYPPFQTYIYLPFLSDEGPTLETLDFTIRIGSTPTFLYFDLYLYSAYATHYVSICM